uniref:Uncharacterized protein n=1 Tax=Strigamia maritima TaxID=126957 RepID=T1J2H7_STRMM
MDIKPTKLTSSDIYIGDNKTDNVNIRFEAGAVETSHIGDNPQGGSSTKKHTSEQPQTVDVVNKHEVKKSPSPSEDIQTIGSGCGDVQIETSNLMKDQIDVVLSDFEDEEEFGGNEEDLECNGITWKWQEAMRDDVGAKGIKCVDVLDEINSHPDVDECGEGNRNESNIFRSTPVMGRMPDKDFSDISSEVIDELDMSAEACSHNIHYPSLLSTSVDDDEDDDDDDEDSTGFHCHDFNSSRPLLSDDVDDGRLHDDDFDNLFEDDLTDPHLKKWLRTKLDQSMDTSERSESNDEELMRLHATKTITMADKGIQVCEEEILLGDNVTDAFAQMDNWLQEGASLQVKSRTSRQTQTATSFLRGRLAAGKDAEMAPEVDGECSDGQMTTEDEVLTMSDEGEQLRPSCRMNEHVKKLMTALPGMTPISTDDGNMWLVPTVDENGNFFNVVVDDGTVWDIFIFRPSNPSTDASTQTSEEELNGELEAQAQHSPDEISPSNQVDSGV